MGGEKRTRRPSGLKTAPVGASFHPPTSVRAGRSRSPLSLSPAEMQCLPPPSCRVARKRVMVTSRDRAFSGSQQIGSPLGNAVPRERSLEISFWGHSGQCLGFLAQASPAGARKQLPTGYSHLLLGPESLGAVT